MTEISAAAVVYKVKPSDGGYTVFRGDKILKTPADANCVLPTLTLAEAVAGEWRAQGKKIEPASMPLTQLAATAIDITGKNRGAIIEEVAGFAAGDLLCFRADNSVELAARQHEIWQPVLDWCAARFGARLKAGQGIMPVKQLPEALDALRRAVESFDDFMLTGIRQAAEVSGSLILALALAERHLAANKVFEAAELDALYQAKKWGEDPVSAERHKAIRNDLAACERWFGLLA